MRQWAIGLLATVVIAVIVHAAAVWAAPRVIMSRTIASLDANGGHNAAVHRPLPTDAAHSVVMPSPDLLYTVCAFDLATGALRIRAEVPDSYWSVSLFAANSDNFFALNDRQAGKSPVELLLVGPGQVVTTAAGRRVIEAPSLRGIVLFRTFVPSAAALPALREAQQRQRCDTVG